ncbi:MAG: hypothetical protein JWQ96_3107 [Segetibacter sp.]|nr:hypothetical protein [Segetibacter sp.]
MSTVTGEAKKDKGLLILSIVVFIYFALLVSISELHYSSVLVGGIIQFLTLPFAAILITVLILAIQSFVKHKFKTNSYSFYCLIILLLTIVLLVVFA